MSGQLRVTPYGGLEGTLTDAHGFRTHLRGVPMSDGSLVWRWAVTVTVTVPPDLRLPWEDGPDEPGPEG